MKKISVKKGGHKTHNMINLRTLFMDSLSRFKAKINKTQTFVK